MRIVFFHLLNDYSGSPKVLRDVISALHHKGYSIDVVTSSGPGALDNIDGNIRYYKYNYQFAENIVHRFMLCQLVYLYMFLLSFRYLFQKDVVFYINTLLPTAPAVAGWIMRKKVIYHYHENATAKGIYYSSKCRAMQFIATYIICVSEYQRSFLRRENNIVIIPNALSKEFKSQLTPNPAMSFERKRILMLSSLKEYKGASQFVEIARLLTEFNFLLIINDTASNVEMFCKEERADIIDNLEVLARQDEVAKFYNNSSLVLNLTNKEMVIETFGLTALEAMSCGLPVIVPTVGGIAEMVEDEVNGWKIDVINLDEIIVTIKRILTDKELYLKLSKNALATSEQYSNIYMIMKIELLIKR